VGFEELGGVDDFPTKVMAERIAKAGVIVVKKDIEAPGPTNSIRTASNNDVHSDDEN